jgi:hypothetical protein
LRERKAGDRSGQEALWRGRKTGSYVGRGGDATVKNSEV